MDMNHIDEVVEVDTTEIWEVKNTDGEFHNFHVHDVQFQVLDIDGQPPAAQFAGWKDTVFLKPGSKARLAMRFSDYTDPDHPYMLHCHRRRHEDQCVQRGHRLDRRQLALLKESEHGLANPGCHRPQRGDHMGPE
jgi:FtsP/CotA-like multicopper oxidase with cupredoxin domain